MNRPASGDRRFSARSLFGRLFGRSIRHGARPVRLGVQYLEDRVTPSADLTQISAGFRSGVFHSLQQQVNGQALDAPLLMIGNQLGTNAVGQILDGLGTQLANFPNTTTTSAQVKAALVAALGGEIQGGSAGIKVLNDNTADVTFQMSLGGSSSAALGFQIGLLNNPLLTVSVPDTQAAVQTTVNWSIPNFTFGV